VFANQAEGNKVEPFAARENDLPFQRKRESPAIISANSFF